MSLKISPVEDQLAVKLKHIWTHCVLQMAIPLDKLVQGAWSTLSLTATTISGWGSLWGDVLQHPAHLGLPGHSWSSDGLEQAFLCVQQLGAGCRSEPAVTALQPKQSVRCCGLKAPTNRFIVKHLKSQEAAGHVANHRAGTCCCCLLHATAAEAGYGVWVAMGAEKGDASLGAGGCLA